MPAAILSGPAGRSKAVPLADRRNCSKPAIFSVRFLLSSMLAMVAALVPLAAPVFHTSSALAVVSGRLSGTIVVLATAGLVVLPPLLPVPFSARSTELGLATPPVLR